MKAINATAVTALIFLCSGSPVLAADPAIDKPPVKPTIVSPADIQDIMSKLDDLTKGVATGCPGAGDGGGRGNCGDALEAARAKLKDLDTAITKANSSDKRG